MALTEVYVDPSIAADSGAGSSGSPYGDIEYALEQVTRDSSNGNRFNIKAGTDEILEFALDIVTDYGTPTEDAPLVFQGYTTAAGDGGIGGISGGGSVSIVDATTLDYVSFIDMHLHNTGSALILNLDQTCHLIRCEFNNSNTANKDIEVGIECVVVGNYFHDMSGKVKITNQCIAGWNYFENGTKQFNAALSMVGSVVLRNIIHLSGSGNSSVGIEAADASVVINNSIWSDAGDGDGFSTGQNAACSMIINNLIEGFSATGGKGITFHATNTSMAINGSNSFEACDTNEDAPSKFTLDDLGVANESLAASPFTDASAGDFSPVDTGAVKEGSTPDDFAGQ
jgi:hypothetical protein